jgi:hypothetical protein
VGRTPGGPARIADVLPQEKRLEPKLGGLEIADGIIRRPAQVTNGFIRTRRDIDRREITRAYQAGELDGVTTVGFHPIARLLGDERWGNDPADVAVLREIVVEPLPTWTRFIDKDQMMAFGWQLADEQVDVALPSANGAKVDAVSAVFFGRICDSNRLLMNIHTDIERARLCHG